VAPRNPAKASTSFFDFFREDSLPAWSRGRCGVFAMNISKSLTNSLVRHVCTFLTSIVVSAIIVCASPAFARIERFRQISKFKEFRRTAPPYTSASEATGRR